MPPSSTQARLLRIGTRPSHLALWQARTVAGLLEAAGARCELVNISTAGDRLQQVPLSEVGGKRLFVKEIEEALLRGDIDLAVHSAKDMSAILPDGLGVAAVLPREDPRDAIVLPGGQRTLEFDDVVRLLGREPTIGTGSVRRSAQLVAALPGARFAAIRGNVDTRLRKLDGGGYDALVLAAAGLCRLGLVGRITTAVPIERCVPAPGQGIIAVETRSDDEPTVTAVRAIHDRTAGIALDAERAVVTALGGGCQLPVGAVALPDGSQLHVRGVVAAPDGSRVISGSVQGDASDASALGRRLAETLMRDGAMDVLDAIRRTWRSVEDLT